MTRLAVSAGFFHCRMAKEFDQPQLAITRFLGPRDQGVVFTQNTTTSIATVLV
jgi:selenocysteine lyase/cysteine desulfurase